MRGVALTPSARGRRLGGASSSPRRPVLGCRGRRRSARDHWVWRAWTWAALAAPALRLSKACGPRPRAPPAATAGRGVSRLGHPHAGVGGRRSGNGAAGYRHWRHSQRAGCGQSAGAGRNAGRGGAAAAAGGLEGDAAVDAWIEQFLHELRTVLFLTGSPPLPHCEPSPSGNRPARLARSTRLPDDAISGLCTASLLCLLTAACSGRRAAGPSGPRSAP